VIQLGGHLFLLDLAQVSRIGASPDRKAWLPDMLGLPDPGETGRYRWELVTPGDGDFMTYGRRMLYVLADRARWEAALAEARRRSDEATDDSTVTERAA
jgi:hypothetical protein